MPCRIQHSMVRTETPNRREMTALPTHVFSGCDAVLALVSGKSHGRCRRNSARTRSLNSDHVSSMNGEPNDVPSRLVMFGFMD